MPKTIKQALVAVGILILSLFGFAYYYFRESVPPLMTIERDVFDYPKLQVENEMGSRLTMDTIVPQNKGVMISFWATWCGPCLKEIPKILASKISDHVRIVWVNLDYGSPLDREKSVREWKTKYKIDLQTFFDGQGELTEQLGITGLPLNLLANKNGKIVWSNVGELDARGIKTLEEKSASL